MALKAYLKDDSLDVILEQPNNILGIEYIKALYKKKKQHQDLYHQTHGIWLP